MDNKQNPYHCDICNYSTHKKDHFNNHLASKKHIKLCSIHASGYNEDKCNENEGYCHKCGIKMLKKNLNNHIKNSCIKTKKNITDNLKIKDLKEFLCNLDVNQEPDSLSEIEEKSDEDYKMEQILKKMFGKKQEKELKKLSLDELLEKITSIGIENLTKEEKEEQKLLVTSDYQKIVSFAPYDIILAFDVFNHLETDIDDCFKRLYNIIAKDGFFYLRTHPYSSRHATHFYKEENKAYMHYVKQCGMHHNKINIDEKYLESVGFSVVSKRDLFQPIENYFTDKFFYKNINEIQFTDYKLRKIKKIFI